MTLSSSSSFAQALFKVNHVAVVLKIKCTCFVNPFSLPWYGLFTVPLDTVRDVGGQKTSKLKYPFHFAFPLCSSSFMKFKPPGFHLHIEMRLQGQFYSLVGLQVT